MNEVRQWIIHVNNIHNKNVWLKPSIYGVYILLKMQKLFQRAEGREMHYEATVEVQ